MEHHSLNIDRLAGFRQHPVLRSGSYNKMAEVGMAALKPGTSVTAMTSKGSDGEQVANMIMVGLGEAPARP